MHQIFIFTAGNKEARSHLQDSILVPADFSKLSYAKDPELSQDVALILGGETSFYAWGAVPGERNPKTWASMSPGDYVFTVYDNEYHFVSRVITKIHSPEVAKEIWGEDPEGKTWEYMYLLTRPAQINKKVDQVRGLNQTYRGFTKISDAKVTAIYDDYKTIDKFIDQVFECQDITSLPQDAIQNEAISQAEQAEDLQPYDPKNMEDGRKKAIAEVVRRQGQPKFKKALLKAYGGACAVTKTKVEPVLEAAHITPYLGPETNHITNGILLRADIHTLFDLKLIRINVDGTIYVSETLLGTEYMKYHNQKITFPQNEGLWPSKEALRSQFDS